MNQRVRVREPFSGRPTGSGDVVEALARMSDDFVEWRADNERRFAAIEAAHEDESKRTAALRITGGKPAAGGWRNDATAQAFVKWLKSGDQSAAAQHLIPVQNAAGTDVGPEGGFLVPDVLDNRIGQLLRNQGVQRRNVTVIPNAPRNWGRVIQTGYSGARKVGERTVPVESQGPSYSVISPPSGTYEAMPGITAQLLNDSSFDLERDILADIATGFSELENADVIRGTGVNEALGWAAPTFMGVSRITNEADKVRAFGKVQYIATGDAAGFHATDPSGALVSMLYSLKAGYRGASRFVMNSNTAAIARRWRDLENRPLWVDSIAADTPPTLLGRPVDLDEDMDDVGAGKYPVALGDWSRAYVMTDINDTYTLRDPFTAKPLILFFVRKSVGGMPVDTNAYKLLKVAAS